MKNTLYLISRISFIILLFILPLFSLSAQELEVRAVVVDENLIPISDVFVKVDGVLSSDISSEKGILLFKANKSSKIEIGKEGYVSMQSNVSGTDKYIVLKRNHLLENQPIAYGKRKKGEIISSMSTINGDKLHNSVSALGTSLYGKLPGLFMQQGQGEPGDDQPLYYFIRGTITFGNASNQPMVMVDGFERDLNTVQVEDVENIAVLKDAAATSLYGARGANGVIQITTKRGETGRVKVNTSIQTGFSAPARVPEFLSSYDFATRYSKAYEMDGLNPAALNFRYLPANIEKYNSGDSYFFPNTNWVKEVTKPTSPSRQADLNVSGGNSIGKYYVSLNYYGAEGIYDHSKSADMNWSTNSEIKRFRFRSNMDVNIQKNWTLKADISGQLDVKNRPMLSANDVWNLLYKTPGNLYPIYTSGTMYGGSSSNTQNPMAEFEKRGYRRYNNRTIMTNVETKYDFSELIKGLSVGLRFGYDNTYSNREGWDRSYQVQDVNGRIVNPDSTVTPVLGAVVGNAGVASYFGPDSDVQNERMTFEGFTEYNRVFSKVHSVNSMLMYHQDKYTLNGDPNAYCYQFLGGRVGYDYKKKYFCEVSFSYSGTENFTKSNRFGFFPAVSAGWMISEENFLKNVKAINYLKLRASTGMVGNSAVGDRFTYIKQYGSADGWIFGSSNTSASGLSEGTYPNVNFTFEKAYKYEIGFETGLMKNLSMWGNVYLEHRTNILTSSSSVVPGIFGGNVANVNAGTTERKGVEFAINYNRQIKNWGFRVGLNGAYNINKILEINEEPKPYEYLMQKGTRIGQPFMLECIGFYKDQADIASSPLQTFGEVKPGDLKYKDQNIDGKIDDNDKKAFFNPFRPKMELGFDIALRYKGFELSGFFQSQLSRSVYLGDNAAIFWPLQNGSSRISTFAANSWTPETSETANYPRLTTVANSNNYRASTFWYRNGDFLRLRTAEFSYSFPHTLLAKQNVKSLKVFVRGLNLWTLDHLNGSVDPETMSNGYPVMKSINLGINLQL